VLSFPTAQEGNYAHSNQGPSRSSIHDRSLRRVGAISAIVYQIHRGPSVATGLGVLFAFMRRTATSPLFLMAAFAIVMLAIKV